MDRTGVASTDDIISQYADAFDKSYTEVFSNYYQSAEAEYLEVIRQFQEDNETFIIDRTHVTEASRKRTLRLIEPHYTKICIYFPSYTVDALMQRITQRSADGGHFVDRKYVEDKVAEYRVPTYTEGFDMIFSASGFERLYKYMDFRE